MLMKSIEEYDHIYIACGYTDMRKGIDGLAYIVKEKFHINPFDSNLFLFCGKRRKFFKALSWEGNGFALYYRRFDGNGASLKWPMCMQEIKDISVGELKSLMSGFSIVAGPGFESIKNADLY